MSLHNDYNKDTFWTSFDESKDHLRYYIKLNSVMIEVDKEVYHCMFNSYRKNLRLQKHNCDNNLISLDADENGHGLYGILRADVDVEKEVSNRLIEEYIHNVITRLDNIDKQIIIGLFYEQRTELELGKQMGISRSTVQKRKQKILSQLRTVINKTDHEMDD